MGNEFVVSEESFEFQNLHKKSGLDTRHEKMFATCAICISQFYIAKRGLCSKPSVHISATYVSLPVMQKCFHYPSLASLLDIIVADFSAVSSETFIKLHWDLLPQSPKNVIYFLCFLDEERVTIKADWVHNY